MKIKGYLFAAWLLIAAVNVLPANAKALSKAPEICAVKADDPSPIEITAYRNRIKIENAPVGSVLEIYSVVGIKVTEIVMKQSSGEYVLNIAKGYYIIRIADTVRKVAIR